MWYCGCMSEHGTRDICGHHMVIVKIKGEVNSKKKDEQENPRKPYKTIRIYKLQNSEITTQYQKNITKIHSFERGKGSMWNRMVECSYKTRSVEKEDIGCNIYQESKESCIRSKRKNLDRV